MPSACLHIDTIYVASYIHTAILDGTCTSLFNYKILYTKYGLITNYKCTPQMVTFERKFCGHVYHCVISNVRLNRSQSGIIILLCQVLLLYYNGENGWVNVL